MSSTPPLRRLRSARAVALAAMVVGALGLAGPAVAQTGEDANLDQTIRSEQAVAGGEKTLADGHVDVGPRFVDGRWTLLIHDDQAKATDGDPAHPSVWRRPERTVLRVTDAAVQEVPDDPTYKFLPAEPGDRVHVVPQTQDPDVVWVGWNTQDPQVMERIDRGATMTLLGVQGPGDLVVYLQSGDFGDPQVLWDSTAKPKPAWVDVNTHTHANWVFTRPGVYLVRVRISADLIDGTTVSDTRDLRFAVGTATRPADALAARWTGPAPAADEPTPAGDGAESGDDDASGSGGVVVVLIVVVVAVALAVALAASLRRERRARARARDERTGGDA